MLGSLLAGATLQRPNVRHLLAQKVATGQLLLPAESLRAVLDLLLRRGNSRMMQLGRELMLEAASAWGSGDTVAGQPVNRQVRRRSYLSSLLDHFCTLVRACRPSASCRKDCRDCFCCCLNRSVRLALDISLHRDVSYFHRSVRLVALRSWSLMRKSTTAPHGVARTVPIILTAVITPGGQSFRVSVSLCCPFRRPISASDAAHPALPRQLQAFVSFLLQTGIGMLGKKGVESTSGLLHAIISGVSGQ